jgi:malonyl-CoA O-methyltransferase
MVRLASDWIRRGFNRAALAYDETARLQQWVESELVSRLDFLDLTPRRILDLGCGTGHAEPALGRAYPGTVLVGIDSAFNFLRRKQEQEDRRSCVFCADARALPLASESIDLVFSNLMLQWCENPGPVFGEVFRVLNGRSPFLFSTFGPRTLHEVKEAWARVDREPHVLDFPGLPELGAQLSRHGFVEVVLDVETVIEEVASLTELGRMLKHMGANSHPMGSHRGLTGRARWQGVNEAYEARRRPGGGLPVTYEIIYGMGWKPSLLRRVGDPS